jgi:hypothetical protein
MEPRSNRNQPRIVDLGLWIDDLNREEDALSMRRRFLQARRDILRAERAERVVGRHVSVDSLPEILAGSDRPPEEELTELTPEEQERVIDALEAFPDVDSLSDTDLDELIELLERAEAAASRRRALLHDRIDYLLLEQTRSGG